MFNNKTRDKAVSRSVFSEGKTRLFVIRKERNQEGRAQRPRSFDCFLKKEREFIKRKTHAIELDSFQNEDTKKQVQYNF